jgi:hypothetical protein
MTRTFLTIGTKLARQKTMKPHRNLARLAFLGVLSLATIISFSAASSATTGNIVKSDLTGNWLITLRGTTGCGFSSMQANVTLGSTGTGTATLQMHGQCGDSTATGQTFTINTLASDGSGTAGLSCGPACGWNFDIQVSPDRSKFNLVDVSSVNPGNYLEGVAILASSSGDIVTSDLTGSWQLTLYSLGGCGIASTMVTFTLDPSGVSTNAAETSHTAGCGDSSSTGNNFTVLSMNANGSGTANLTCGTDCGFNFNIQVSPDRSTFNLVDLTNGGNYLAGVAINNSTAGKIVDTNLAGKWQVAIYGQGGCGIASSLVTFTLSAKGVATNASETSHTAGCGDSKSSGNTFTVTSLNADGSGTANLTCGTACGFNYNIQVSPDRSTFNLVDVSTANPGNFQIGTAIHQ